MDELSLPEIVSYLLNLILASSIIRFRNNDADKYNDDIEKFKTQITALTIDAKSYWGGDRRSTEMKRLASQNATEFHHFVADCQDFNRRYKSFDYTDAIATPLSDLKKVCTGAGEYPNLDRLEKIDEFSIKLRNAFEQCRINKKLKHVLCLWQKI